MKDRAEDGKDDVQKPAHGFQFYSAICASLGILSIGSVMAYSSPATFQLRRSTITNNNSVASDITSYDVHYTTEAVVSVVFTTAGDFDVNASTLYNAQSQQQRDVTAEKTTSIHNITDNSITNLLKKPRTQDNILSKSEIVRQQPSNVYSSFTLSNDEIDWFLSAFSIGALVGGLISGVLLSLLGRRGTMVASALPSLTGWLLIGLGRSFGLLFAGRLLTGVFVGIITSAVHTYIAEIASSDIRGTIGSSTNVMFSIGILYSYIIGSVTTWDQLSLICLVPSMLFSVLMFFNYESPTYLVAKGKVDQAIETLQHFRGSNYNVLGELSALEGAHQEASQRKLSAADLKRPAVYKPLIIVSALMILQQFSGVNALIFNLVTIFKSAGNEMSAYGSSVMVAAVQLVASLVSVPLVDLAGRKFLLIFSGILMFFCQGCIGLYFYLLESSAEWTIQYLWWLPLISVMLFVIGFGLGIGYIPWLLMSELFPVDVRETASAVIVAVNCISSFFVLYYFQSMQVYLHIYGVYWVFAGFSLCIAIFTALFVKETKGKTLHEITAMFES